MPYLKPSPPIGLSVSTSGSDAYRMGSRILCRKSTSGIPDTAVAAWEEGDGHYYFLEATSNMDSLSFQQAAKGLIYQAGMSSAVWEIGGNAICKVKTWTEGMESESSTLDFVASRFPHIPLPKVIYSWVDEQQGRTFLLLRRVKGQTLTRVWPSLSLEQRSHVAATVAQYCYDLAEVTSENMQSATGRGVLEPFLTVDTKPSHPLWKPQPLGPLSRFMTERYLQKLSTQPTPTIGDKFHFYHADLGPTNILISNDDGSSITAVLDWESAGFYPKFWIPLKPYRSGGFNLDALDNSRYDWTDLLESNLANVGFVLDHDHVAWQKTLDFTFFELSELLR